MKNRYLFIFLVCLGLCSNAQNVLKIKGANSGKPVLYLQNGAKLYVEGTINIDHNITVSNLSNNYLQNNGIIELAPGVAPGQSNLTNNVSGLQTYTTGQTTGTVLFAADNETQTISGGGTVGFMNLTVNNVSSPEVNLQSDISVAGTLNLGGLINLQSNNLTLLSTGSLSGSPFSAGNMVQADGTGQYIQGIGVIGSNTTFIFPVGDASPAYSPVSLTLSSNSSAGTIGVNVTNGTEPNMNTPAAPTSYLSRFWTFSNSGLSNYTYTGTFTYPEANVNGQETSLHLSEWTGSAWTEYPGSSANSGLLTESTPLTQANAPLSGDVTGRTQCVICISTWIGPEGGDWNNAANWSPAGVPNSCSASVVISAGSPVISSSDISIGDINISAGATITLTARNLNVCGNWVGGNRADASVLGNGTVILNGSTLQLLSGFMQFQLLQLNNPAGAQMQTGSSYDIFSALVLQNGNLDVTNGVVTLKSTSVSSFAYLDNFAAGSDNGTYSGNITAERFYAAATAFNDFNQHMLGLPVGGNNLSTLGANGSDQFYIPATGGIHNCNELLGAMNTPYGNVFRYIEASASSCVQAGWQVAAAADPALAGAGYSVLLDGGRSSILSVIGPPNLNPSYNVSTTNSGYANTTSDQGNVYPSGINLLSNPYPATLTASSLVTDNPNYVATVYVWNESNGAYYTPATIAPFQAFKVIRTVEGTGNYVINGTARTTGTGTFQRTRNPIELNLTVTNNTSGLTDETTVGFNPNATTGFDQPYDLIKLPGAPARHTLYTVNNNNWMWANILNSINQTTTVPVGFEPGVTGKYTFTFNGINSFDPTSYVMLEDRQAGTMHDVRNGDYVFTANAADNFNRFVLHFTPPAVILTQDASCETSGMINIEQPGIANWSYTVLDNNNATISSGVLNSNNPISVNATVGTYSITLRDNAGYTVVKMIEVQGTQPIVAAFATSAKTVQVNDNVIFSSTSNASAYNWDFGDGSTGNGRSTSHTYTTEGVYTIALTVSSGNGCVSTNTQVITITSRSVTGISNLADNKLGIWSADNRVFVDFTKTSGVDAEVQLYNVLGQLLSDERLGKSDIYSKQLTNMEAAYIIVKVTNDDKITTKKVFIANINK